MNPPRPLRSPFLLEAWLAPWACLRVGRVQVKSRSLCAAWPSYRGAELAKLASLRPLHRDSSENVLWRVRLGAWERQG